MAYIVQADLTEQLSEAQLIQLTDDEQTGLVMADRVTRAMVSAESEINGFLGTRYTVPLSGVIPDLVQKWTVTIAVYLLYRRRQRVPEEVRRAYDDAISRLRDIALGRLTLGIVPDTATSPQSNMGEVFGPARIFTRDTLGGF